MLSIAVYAEIHRRSGGFLCARRTGLEPATSRVTGECSNQIELPPQVICLLTTAQVIESIARLYIFCNINYLSSWVILLSCFDSYEYDISPLHTGPDECVIRESILAVFPHSSGHIANVAQSVERIHGKDEVRGSIRALAPENKTTQHLLGCFVDFYKKIIVFYAQPIVGTPSDSRRDQWKHKESFWIRPKFPIIEQSSCHWLNTFHDEVPAAHCNSQDELFDETVASPMTHIYLLRAADSYEAVGMFLGTIKPAFLTRSLYIDAVVVAPAWRGQGVAEKRLVPAMIELAQRSGCSQIDLTTSKPAAARVYERAGFNGGRTTAFRIKALELLTG